MWQFNSCKSQIASLFSFYRLNPNETHNIRHDIRKKVLSFEPRFFAFSFKFLAVC